MTVPDGVFRRDRSRRNGAVFDPYGFADVRDPVRLAAGDEHLAAADLVEDEILPQRVQLGEHVVQQQYRLLAGILPENVPLGQLEADRAGPGLALGAEGLDGQAVDGGLEIVLVRPGKALHGLQLRPVMTFLVLPQLRADRLYVRRGVCHRGDGLVAELQTLPVAGKGGVVDRGALGQLAQIPGPGGDEDRPGLGHALVELRQGLQHPGIVDPLLQNGGLLDQEPFILLQGPGIAGPELTKGVVQELSALGRPLFEHKKILRAEQDRVEHAVQLLPGGFFDAGEPQLPGPAAGKQHRAEGLLPPVGFYPGRELGILRAESDQLRLLPGAEGRAAAETADRLQQIRLALGVFPDDQIDPGVEFAPERLVAPEVGQV